MRRTTPGLMFCALLSLAVPSLAATVSGTLTLKGIRPERAIVYLDSLEPFVPLPAPVHVTMDQKNLSFSPEVLPVVRGTVVEFTNSDNVLHNVFSPSPIAGKFDLGSYSQGETHRVTLNTPGEVLILCNIHMEMEAHILVLNNPYFATTASDGSFQIPEVPPGSYTLKIWREHPLSYTQPLQVPATGVLTLQLQVER